MSEQETKPTFKDVLNPKVPRPPKDSPLRDDYDQTFRAMVHLAMIGTGIIAAIIMTAVGANLYFAVAMQGVLPGAVQEVGDFLLKL